MFNKIKSAIVNLVSRLAVNPLSHLDPKVAADIVAVYHIIALILLGGCVLGMVLMPQNIVGLLAAFGIIEFSSWMLYLVHKGCPVTKVENVYRKKAGQDEITFSFKYAISIMSGLLRKLMGM